MAIWSNERQVQVGCYPASGAQRANAGAVDLDPVARAGSRRRQQ